MVEYDLTPDDKFLVLASDGVWEFVSCEDSVAIVHEEMSKAEAEGGKREGSSGSNGACQPIRLDGRVLSFSSSSSSFSPISSAAASGGDREAQGSMGKFTGYYGYRGASAGVGVGSPLALGLNEDGLGLGLGAHMGPGGSSASASRRRRQRSIPQVRARERKGGWQHGW